MAGIGFVLKRLFIKDTFIDRTKAFVYSSVVAAGPWIAAVATVNIILLLSRHYLVAPGERLLFMGTIVYSFIFSQIITAPWQLLVTRYISDKLFSKEYDYIKPSFIGLSKITFFFVATIAIAFYYHKPLPLYYEYMAGALFIVLALIWIITVFLNAAKNYTIVAKAFIFGGVLSIFLVVLFSIYPLPFNEFRSAGNILLAYLVGMLITYIILLYSFFNTFYFGNKLEYDFLRYLNKVPSLFFTGLFYTMGLWVDNILIWHTPMGALIHETYRYAPLYDQAIFLAYLTIIPTMVLFLVHIETEFYDKYKKYYKTVSEKSTYDEIIAARDEMRDLIYRQIAYLLENQVLFTFTIIVLSDKIFVYLGLPILVESIFRITALGALSNGIMLVVLLMLLYFEAWEEALLVAISFFILNLGFTYYFIPQGTELLGVGFFIAATATLVFALILLFFHLKKITYFTFSRQPAFYVEDRGLFVAVANLLNSLANRRKTLTGIVDMPGSRLKQESAKGVGRSVER